MVHEILNISFVLFLVVRPFLWCQGQGKTSRSLKKKQQKLVVTAALACNKHSF